MLKKYIKYIYPAIIAISTFMFFRERPYFERTWFFYGIALLIPLFLAKDYFKTKTFIAIAAYIIFIWLNIKLGRDYFKEIWFPHFFPMFISTSALYVMLKFNDVRAMKNTLWLFFLMLIQTTIASFIIDLQIPNAIRFIAGEGFGEQDVTQYKPFFQYGLSNYFLPHALPALIPGIYIGIVNDTLKWFVRVFLGMVLLATVILIYLSGSSTAMLLAIMAIILMLVVKKTTLERNIMKIVIVGIVMLPFLSSEFVLAILSPLESLTEGTYFHGKIIEFQHMAVSGGTMGGGDAEARVDLYSKSINSFLNNPIIGSTGQLGGHSSIMDRLAVMGIVGMIPLIYFFYIQYKTVLLHLDKNLHTYYVIGFFMSMIMILLKNMMHWEMMIITFTILPISIMVFGKDYSKDTHNDIRLRAV